MNIFSTTLEIKEIQAKWDSFVGEVQHVRKIMKNDNTKQRQDRKIDVLLWEIKIDTLLL